MEILNETSYPYIATEPDYLVEALTIINNHNDIQNKMFLDVGSGIGNMCYIATLKNLIAHGIELNPILFEISKQIYPEINVYNIDIREFNEYQNYDIIFYCVPFADEQIQKELKEKIENDIKVGSYIITRGFGEIKDDRFVGIDTNTIKNRIWVKMK